MFFTEEEKVLIQEAIAEGGDIWNNDKVADIKVKIKKHYRDLYENEACCYCRRDFKDEFNMVIDIEHILPKSKYGEFMFELGNLNISCKRCNMLIKKERHDFVVDLATIRVNYQVSAQYRFIHPNLDVYHDNLSHFNFAYNNLKLVKFTAKSKKGEYTIDYFHLKKIEINNFNNAQGIVLKTDGDFLSVNLSEQDSDALEGLLKNL